MENQLLDGGFAAPPVDAAIAFRAIMNAMAQPGTIQTVTGAMPPAPLSVAAGVALLTLCDPETPLFLGAGIDSPALRDWITFHCGAPFVTADQAQFALGAWNDLPLIDFPLGNAEYPDRSATLIVELPELTDTGTILRGPGIKDQAQLSLPDTAAFQRNNALFPLGLDFIFTCGDRLAGLPRSTRIG
ncbi:MULTISPECIES: phosphonate C-P lyase system protein PhnH [unclassified Yoonia]|uniref:phosphonate C-P lyase system protein PhnH n=1 Tax=unclassified Yoonia TaxID=2629118 RepID=UPI002B002C5E|nr:MULTISPECIES: phosphonate C-P lyase system protein PhnH [unclassified Yoonia]